MRSLVICLGCILGCILSALPVMAQQPAQMPAAQQAAQVIKLFTPSADVPALIAKAKSERKEGQPLVTEPLLQLAPYNANLEYRPSVGSAALHEREAELMYVIDGTATMITGGTLVKPTRTNADNLTGTGIEGGSSRAVQKGDFIMVPENTPHWFSAIDGTLILMTLHLPRTVGSPAR